jgi:hypothetical protein
LLFLKHLILPAPFDTKLKELMDASKNAETEKVEALIKSVDDKAKEYLDETEISKRTYDNVKMFTTLAGIYSLKNKGKNETFGVFKDEVVNRFSNWLDNSSGDAINYNLTKIFIRNTYQNGLVNNKVSFNDGLIYIPYSLNNDITVYTIKLQQKLHEYSNSFLTGNTNYQTLVKEFTEQHSN